jgi:predicted RNase H-like nuclease (RuvC/YqgF family)
MIYECSNCGFYQISDPRTGVDGVIYWINNNIRDRNGNIKIFCEECIKALREKEIEKRKGFPIDQLESKETFEDFIEKSREWHQRQLDSKDNEILKLQLQLKEKENEVLTLKLKGLELKLKAPTAENQLRELAPEAEENILQFSELQTADFNLNE